MIDVGSAFLVGLGIGGIITGLVIAIGTFTGRR
jgi:hypothetical protein